LWEQPTLKQKVTSTMWFPTSIVVTTVNTFPRRYPSEISIPLLGKTHDDTWQRSYHCYATTENHVSMEAIRQNRETRPMDNVFITGAQRSYLRRTNTGAVSTHIKTDTTQYYRQAASVWRHAVIRCPLHTSCCI
jgi:hypothetical protein